MDATRPKFLRPLRRSHPRGEAPPVSPSPSPPPRSTGGRGGATVGPNRRRRTPPTPRRLPPAPPTLRAAGTGGEGRPGCRRVCRELSFLWHWEIIAAVTIHKWRTARKLHNRSLGSFARNDYKVRGPSDVGHQSPENHTAMAVDDIHPLRRDERLPPFAGGLKTLSSRK